MIYYGVHDSQISDFMEISCSDYVPGITKVSQFPHIVTFNPQQPLQD